MGNLKTLKIVTVIFDNYLSIAIYFFYLIVVTGKECFCIVYCKV